LSSSSVAFPEAVDVFWIVKAPLGSTFTIVTECNVPSHEMTTPSGRNSQPPGTPFVSIEDIVKLASGSSTTTSIVAAVAVLAPKASASTAIDAAISLVTSLSPLSVDVRVLSP
jgi:hypothetical protein